MGHRDFVATTARSFVGFRSRVVSGEAGPVVLFPTSPAEKGEDAFKARLI
jgi:hypothetical protein